jgi:hypothetical protein
MLMLTSSNSRRTPHPYTLLPMLLLIRKLYEDREHAWDFFYKPDDFT